jgi:hypothetical protein
MTARVCFIPYALLCDVLLCVCPQVFDASTTVPLPSARVRMRGTHHPLWFMDDDAASELQRAFPQP